MPLGGAAQVPTVCPLGMVHTPLQHSEFWAQMSPVCWQYDDGWHVPPAHRPEQHCALPVHASPSVPQVEIDAQVPPAHVWLQHWLFDVQCAPVPAQAVG
jgi:hypothetical protein